MRNLLKLIISFVILLPSIIHSMEYNELISEWKPDIENSGFMTFLYKEEQEQEEKKAAYKEQTNNSFHNDKWHDITSQPSTPAHLYPMKKLKLPDVYKEVSSEGYYRTTCPRCSKFFKSTTRGLLHKTLKKHTCPSSKKRKSSALDSTKQLDFNILNPTKAYYAERTCPLAGTFTKEKIECNYSKQGVVNLKSLAQQIRRLKEHLESHHPLQRKNYLTKKEHLANYVYYCEIDIIPSS